MGYEVSGSGELVFGKRIVDLTLEEAERARELMQDRGLSVYCFSTQLFEPDIELGETVFRDEHLEKVNHTIEIARIMQPKMIRLLADQTASRAAIADSSACLTAEHPWVLTGLSVSCFIPLSQTDPRKLSLKEEITAVQDNRAAG